MNTDYTLNFANDLGYGAIKGSFNGTHLKVPSVVVQQSAENIQDPLSFDSDSALVNYMENQFLNEMDVSVNSSSIGIPGRFLIGQAAVDSGLPVTMFDVNDFSGKSEDDLAMILTLVVIAGYSLKDLFKLSYQRQQQLPDQVTVQVNMTTALPIAEGKRPGTRKKYREKYLNGQHQVTFHNFTKQLSVNVVFNQIYVALEGETAQLKIRQADEDLQSLLYKDFVDNYPELGRLATATDLINADNVVGIDIGEGTTDLVSIVNGKANANASSSLATGYGNVLQEAIDVLQAQQMNFESRAQLQSYLTSRVSPFAQQHQQKVAEIVFDQLEPFADQIVQSLSKVMRLAGAKTELIFVYGGGSIPMRQQSHLREKLVEKLRKFNGGDDIPVIWVDPKYAQTLNEAGLELVLQALDN